MAGKKTPKRLQKYDYRYRKGRKEGIQNALLLLKDDIARQANGLIEDIRRIENQLKRL